MYSIKQKLNKLQCDCENNNFHTEEVKNAMNQPDNKVVHQVKNGKKHQEKDINCNQQQQQTNGKRVKSVEVRKEEVLAIRNRFPTKIPVIVQRFYKETYLPQLDKSKFLVPQEITMSQFQTIIRNRMRMGPNQALYLLVNEKAMMSLSLTLAEIYSEHAGTDGFLYVTYASQEAFGSEEHGSQTQKTHRSYSTSDMFLPNVGNNVTI